MQYRDSHLHATLPSHHNLEIPSHSIYGEHYEEVLVIWLGWSVVVEG